MHCYAPDRCVQIATCFGRILNNWIFNFIWNIFWIIEYLVSFSTKLYRMSSIQNQGGKMDPFSPENTIVHPSIHPPLNIKCQGSSVVQKWLVCGLSASSSFFSPIYMAISQLQSICKYHKDLGEGELYQILLSLNFWTLRSSFHFHFSSLFITLFSK